MASNWITYMTSARRTAWGIPQERYNGLADLHDAAAAILQKAKDTNQRTPVVTALCQEAFKDLGKGQRFFKSHYFLIPPLTLEDFYALGFREGSDGSLIPVPDGQPTADFGYPDPHVIDILNIRPRQAHSTDPRSDYGVAIKLGIVGGTDPYHIDAAPAADKGITLPFYKFTRRRRERFDFTGNSGKLLCVSLAYENGKGEEGPYCPVMQVIIP
jgi:hypothetical protein